MSNKILAGIIAAGLMAFAAAPSQAEGALAVDNTGKWWGISWNYPNEESAKGGALYRCQSDGRICQVVVTYGNTCAAGASDYQPGSKRYAAGRASPPIAARNASIANCVAGGTVPTQCRVRIEGCDETGLVVGFRAQTKTKGGKASGGPDQNGPTQDHPTDR
jgi:hypothetical protein